MEQGLVPLIRTSLRTPRDAAEQILGFAFSRDTLWTGLALVAVVNTIFMYLTVELSLNENAIIPSYFERPFTLFFLTAGVTVVYVHAMYWAGHAIGGQGTLMDVLAVVVWFQVLSALARAAVVFLSLAVPSLGAFLSLVVVIWGTWIFMNFLAVALNLNTPWHSIVVLMVAFVGLAAGIGLLTVLVSGFA